VWKKIDTDEWYNPEAVEGEVGHVRVCESDVPERWAAEIMTVGGTVFEPLRSHRRKEDAAMDAYGIMCEKQRDKICVIEK